MAFEIETVYRAPAPPKPKNDYIYEYHFQDWDQLILEPEDYTEDDMIGYKITKKTNNIINNKEGNQYRVFCQYGG